MVEEEEEHPPVSTGGPHRHLVAVKAAVLECGEHTARPHPHHVYVVPVGVVGGEELEPLLALRDGEQPAAVAVPAVIGHGAHGARHVRALRRLAARPRQAGRPRGNARPRQSSCLLALKLEAQGVDVPAEGLGELGLGDGVGIDPGEEGGGEGLLVGLCPVQHGGGGGWPAGEVPGGGQHGGGGGGGVGDGGAVRVQVELALPRAGVPSHVAPALAPGQQSGSLHSAILCYVLLCFSLLYGGGP